MAETYGIERLTALDDYPLWADDMGWPWDIGVIATLDGSTLTCDDGELDIERVRRHIESRLHLAPRLRQCIRRPARGLGPPLWIDAPTFDVNRHVAVYRLERPVDENALVDAVATLRRRPFDPRLPLWEMWFLPGLSDGRVGMFWRAHHAIVDGTSGVATLAAFVDLQDDAPGTTAPAWAPRRAPTMRELLSDNVAHRAQRIKYLCTLLWQPRRMLALLRTALPVWREIFTEDRAPRSSLNRRIGADRRIAVVRTRLDLAKTIGHAYGATVNDVVLTAVAGGLRELLQRRGEPVQDLLLRVMVPVSLHREGPGAAQGNLNGLMAVPLTVGEPDDVRRLRLIAAETAQRKKTARPQALSTGVFALAAARRLVTRMAVHQWLFNLSVTNVPGPPVPVYLAGARALEMFPFIPIVGNQTLNVGVLSYDGQLNLTAVADRERVTDLDVFREGAEASLAALARSAGVPAA